MSTIPERVVIQLAGLTAVAEYHAWEDDPDQRGRKRLWMLGLVGTRQMIEEIRAKLIQDREKFIAPRPLVIGCPLDGTPGRAAFPTLSRRRKSPATGPTLTLRLARRTSPTAGSPPHPPSTASRVDTEWRFGGLAGC